jgi:ATP-dependent Clp protease adapter protein ClpS
MTLVWTFAYFFVGAWTFALAGAAIAALFSRGTAGVPDTASDDSVGGDDPALAAELRACVEVAVHEAQFRKLRHVEANLFILAAIGDARIRASIVDSGRSIADSGRSIADLRSRLLVELESAPTKAESEALVHADELLRALTAGRAAAGRDWLYNIVASLLAARGVTIQRTPIEIKQGPAVRIFNDEKTTMDFVLETLMRNFDLPREAAAYVMRLVHRSGSADVPCGTLEAGRAIVDRILREALESDFPLRVEVVQTDDFGGWSK